MLQFQKSDNHHTEHQVNKKPLKIFHKSSIELDDLIYLEELSDYFYIPPGFLEDIRCYAIRNIIFNDPQNIDYGKICCKCLKGYIITRAKELNLSDNFINVIFKIFKCEPGHSGYYLDENLTLKISES